MTKQSATLPGTPPCSLLNLPEVPIRPDTQPIVEFRNVTKT